MLFIIKNISNYKLNVDIYSKGDMFTMFTEGDFAEQEIRIGEKSEESLNLVKIPKVIPWAPLGENIAYAPAFY